MPAWNPKCVKCDSNGRGEGSTFTAVFEMSGKQVAAKGEVVEFDQFKTIRFRYQYDEGTMQGSVEESYSIKTESPNRVQVRHVVDFKNSGLPLWVRLIIGFLGRFGNKMGREPLDGIEDLLNFGND